MTRVVVVASVVQAGIAAGILLLDRNLEPWLAVAVAVAAAILMVGAAAAAGVRSCRRRFGVMSRAACGAYHGVGISGMGKVVRTIVECSR